MRLPQSLRSFAMTGMGRLIRRKIVGVMLSTGFCLAASTRGYAYSTATRSEEVRGVRGHPTLALLPTMLSDIRGPSLKKSLTAM